MDKFPSRDESAEEIWLFQTDRKDSTAAAGRRRSDHPCEGSGTYVSYEGQLIDDNRPQVGLLLSYYSEYLFPEIYDGIESSLSEKDIGLV